MRGIEYVYKGPAHLSVGQEAAAVESAMALGPQDQIFGSHRSHGEIIAKRLAAVNALDEESLQSIMAGHSEGQLLKLVAEHVGSAGGAVADAFLLTGVLAEIFMRDAGFNRGTGGQTRGETMTWDRCRRHPGTASRRDGGRLEPAGRCRCSNAQGRNPAQRAGADA